VRTHFNIGKTEQKNNKSNIKSCIFRPTKIAPRQPQWKGPSSHVSVYFMYHSLPQHFFAWRCTICPCERMTYLFVKHRTLCLLVLPAFLVSVVVPWVVVLNHPLKVVVGRLAVTGFGGGVPLGLSLDPDELLLAVVVVGVERMADGHGQWEECDESLKCKTVKNSIRLTLFDTQQNINNTINNTVRLDLLDLVDFIIFPVPSFQPLNRNGDTIGLTCFNSKCE